jgi:hypothetical protein
MPYQDREIEIEWGGLNSIHVDERSHYTHTDMRLIPGYRHIIIIIYVEVLGVAVMLCSCLGGTW